MPRFQIRRKRVEFAGDPVNEEKSDGPVVEEEVKTENPEFERAFSALEINPVEVSENPPRAPENPPRENRSEPIDIPNKLERRPTYAEYQKKQREQYEPPPIKRYE